MADAKCPHRWRRPGPKQHSLTSVSLHHRVASNLPITRPSTLPHLRLRPVWCAPNAHLVRQHMHEVRTTRVTPAPVPPPGVPPVHTAIADYVCTTCVRHVKHPHLCLRLVRRAPGQVQHVPGVHGHLENGLAQQILGHGERGEEWSLAEIKYGLVTRGCSSSNSSGAAGERAWASRGERDGERVA